MAECPKYITYRKVKETETEVLYEQFLPQTNADRIRMMTVEELAEFLDIVFDPWCDARCKNGVEISCQDCILEWLKKESE